MDELKEAQVSSFNDNLSCGVQSSKWVFLTNNSIGDGNRSVAILQVSRGWEDQLNQSLQLIPTKSPKSKDLSYGKWGPRIESMVISAWKMLVKKQPPSYVIVYKRGVRWLIFPKACEYKKHVLLIQGFSRWNSRNISMQICMDTLVNCTKPTDLRQPKCLLRFDCSYPSITPKNPKNTIQTPVTSVFASFFTLPRKTLPKWNQTALFKSMVLFGNSFFWLPFSRVKPFKKGWAPTSYKWSEITPINGRKSMGFTWVSREWSYFILLVTGFWAHLL